MNSSKTFSNIRFKKKTAQRFQTFSRQFFKTHTVALQTMLDFFFYNEISPKESFGPNARTLGNLIKKRFNGLAAIMKEMERHGVLPTKAMMELLFEHTPQNSAKQGSTKPGSKGKNIQDDAFFTSAFESIELQKENTILKQKLDGSRNRLKEVLDNIQVTKGGFGKTKLVLHMDITKFQELKSLSK